MRHAVSHGVVDVWRLHVLAAPADDLTQSLTDAERAHAARFLRQRDRDRFISVRGWLRRLLGAYLDQPAGALAFETGDQGKPALLGQSGADGLRFNVSHSGDLGIVAVCRGREVGVDLEEIRNNFDVIELGRSCFSSDEHDALRSCASETRVERFFQLWTAKEACIKALGGGLSIPLQDFTVSVQRDRDRWSVTSAGVTGAVTEIRPLVVPQGYAGAVTAFGTRWEIRERDVADWAL